jgi:hypothetical protein
MKKYLHQHRWVVSVDNMRINEVASIGATPDPVQLLGLAQFLAGRADDTNAQKQISQDAFVNLAQSLDIPVNRANLDTLVNQEPLSNILEPMEPGSSEPIKFKGATPDDTSMPVNKAQDIVANAAKSAMKKNRNV